MRVHVVANLNARGLAADSHLSGVRARCARGVALHETRSVDELADVAEVILADAPDLIVLAGGDGTFMSGVTALTHALERSGARGAALPKIGLLPLGTVGTIARNFGERGEPLALLGRWLDAPTRVAALPRPTLRVRADTRDGVADRIGFIVGTGLVARFFEVYEAGGAKGIPLAGRIVARVFAESFTGGPLAEQILSPLPCVLEVDGEVQPIAGVSLLCAAVVRDLGLGMKVCYRAGERADRFHLVASSLPPAKLGPRAPLVVMGRSIGGDRHVDALVERFVVRFPDADGPWVLDGDMFRAKSFTVTAGPVVPIVG
jgi:diacylglycerol kinase family enzyme